MRNNEEKWLPDEELTPCMNCDKPFTVPVLNIIKINMGVVDIRACNQRLGMTQMFAGHAELARIMGSYPDGVVKVNTDPELKVQVLICQNCFVGNLNMAVLREKAFKLAEQKKELQQKAG